MNYGYIRVSTDKQTVENQKIEIKKYCKGTDYKSDFTERYNRSLFPK